VDACPHIATNSCSQKHLKTFLGQNFNAAHNYYQIMLKLSVVYLDQQ